jgi:glycosyltransferase involved in cell wall biosynthesis
MHASLLSVSMTSALTAGVIITNYNYGRFLGACIDSALNQTRPAVEVIVVDDGSTDESASVLASFGDRIRVIRTRNLGQAAALARGIRESTADLLCLLDADDTWTPDKIARVTAVFAAQSQVDWLRHKLMVTDDALRPMGATIPPFSGNAIVPPRPLAIIERAITAATSGLVVRAQVADDLFDILGGNQSFFAWDADALLLARLTALGAVGYSLDAVLANYRRHAGQQYDDAPSDMRRMLERQLAVNRALAAVFGVSAGIGVVDHKHRLILATLQGRGLAHPVRLLEAARGTAASLRAFPVDPALALRQFAALGLAFIAPTAWINRLLRTQGVRSR